MTLVHRPAAVKVQPQFMLEHSTARSNAMIRYCSVLIAAIMLSGCGNFLGNMGERMSGEPDANERKKAESARQRQDSK